MFTKAAILFFVVAGFATPQDPTGSISGMVQDSTDALVPGVQVSAESIATGLSWLEHTNERGRYTISGLPPGLYRVVVRLAGFTPGERPVRVGSGIPTTSVNFKLEVDKVEAQIDVPVVVPLLRDGDPTVGSTIQYDFMKLLPVNGLNPLSNVRTAPSVREVATNGGRNFVDPSGAAQGTPGGKTLQAMDGVSTMSVGGIGSAMSFSPDATEEIRISTSTFPLSTGATLYGVVSSITRSGGNNFHGSAFYVVRDNVFDAYPTLRRDPANPDPSFHRRHAGLNLSGPVRTGRLFAFGIFERNDQRGVSATTLEGPDFGHLSRITTSPSYQNLAGVRVDGLLPRDQKAFFRYSYDDSRSFAPPGLSTNTYPSGWLDTKATSGQAVLGVTGPLSHAMLNEFRVSYFSTNFRRVGAQDEDCPGCLGVGTPSIIVQQDGLVLGNSDTTVVNGNRLQINDSVTLQFKNHYAVFGFDWQHSRGGQVNTNDEPATITLYSPSQARQFGIQIPSTFNTLEDILNLPVRTVQIAVGDAQVPQANGGRVRAWDAARFHFQDKWQVHPRMVLNYGLAWSIDRNLNYDLPAPRFLAPVLGEKSLGLRRKQWKNFSPLFGLTWRPPMSERTLLRAGAGLYYDFLLPQNLDAERVALGPPGTGRQTFRGSGIVNTLTGVPNLPVESSLDFPRRPTPFTGANFMAILPAIRDALHQSRTTSDPFVQQIQVTKAGDLIAADFPVASSLHVNVGFTRQLTKSFSVDADFVLKRTHHLGIGAIDVSHFNSVRGPLIPKCKTEQKDDPAAECLNGPITAVQPVGRANYRGLLVRAEQEFRRLRFIGSWAYSRHTGTGGGGTNGFNLENWHENHGPLATDFTHIFNLAAVTQLPRGFQLGLNFSYLSAPPFSAYLDGIDLNGDGNRSANNRIIGDLLPGTTKGVFNRGMGHEDLERLVDEFNRTKAGTPDAFGLTLPQLTLPTSYSFDDDFQALDLRLGRAFKISERYELTLNVEVFNVFNIANLSGHAGNLINPATFGQPVARSSQVFGSGGPRAFQFGVKVKF